MMEVMRRVGTTIVLFGVGWAVGACGSSVFACSSDEQCQGGATPGVCQAEGYCSFPDDSCPSGHRFGDAAPPGVANACVGVSDDGSSSSGPGPQSNDAVEPPDPDDGVPEGSTTTPVGDGTTTVSVDDDGTSTGPGPEPTTGMESEGTTTGVVETCTPMFEDEFEGTELDPAWGSFAQSGTELWVSDGVLAISVGPAPAWTVAGVVMDIDSLAGGWVRVTIPEADDSGYQIAGGVVAGNEVCQLQLFMDSGGVVASIWNDEELATTPLGYQELPGTPLWLQLRQDHFQTYFEWSIDEETWNEVAAGSFPECGDLLGPVTTGINAGGLLEEGTGPGTRLFDRFEMCLR